MSINDIIVYIMAFFMVLGAIDKILKNKFKLGEQFDKGIMTMGPLALVIIGMTSLAPVIAKILTPVIVPVYTFLGADPSMFATTILANDMGGEALAMNMALSKEAGLFSGLILGSMMGTTITYTLPVAIIIMGKENYKFLAKGILIGTATIPIGCLAGGIIAGFEIKMLLSNLVPIVLISALLILALLLAPDRMITAFIIFGRGVFIVITIGLALITFETLTGIVILKGMAPASEGIQTVGHIALMLSGAFPMIYVLTQVLKKPLVIFGKMLGINVVASDGLVATLANNIPMFMMLKDMNDRGKIVNVAFAVSASFVFGDHLGFTASIDKSMIVPMIVAKLIAGVTAVVLALLLTRKTM